MYFFLICPPCHFQNLSMTKNTLFFFKFACFCTNKRCTRIHCLVLKNNPNYVIFFKVPPPPDLNKSLTAVTQTNVKLQCSHKDHDTGFLHKNSIKCSIKMKRLLSIQYTSLPSPNLNLLSFDFFITCMMVTVFLVFESENLDRFSQHPRCYSKTNSPSLFVLN